ncbi:MAG: glucosaminidase domain-containing protein [Bacteroidota bacterium]
MHRPNLPVFRPFSWDLPKLQDYLRAHWFRILLIALALYIVLVKDIQFQISMNSAPANPAAPTYDWGNAEPGTSKGPNGSEATLSMMPEMGEEGQATPVVHQRNKSARDYRDPLLDETLSAERKAEIQNLANTFSNLTFVLSPDYAQRKRVPEAVVAVKMAKCYRYVQRFAPVAKAEMNKYGIPASITLAQGLLESNVGESRLTKANHNHFGIKCFSRKCRKGHCSNFTDDTHKDFFRIYQSSWESYRAHSIFLQGKRYAPLKDLGTTDYAAWARGLRKAGYATDKRYAEKLIQIIEALELHQYDE